MSGKAKQANRTKNNARPSSSGRSAELLSNTVNPALVLVGPGNMLPAVFPSLAGPTAEQPLSNEFVLCFKKFHKKDPITKIKALNELKELVACKEEDEVVNALGSWAHYYPSLTVDMDRKVREATQSCHGAIVRKCGRQVALHIKRLLPAWLMAQHDEHAPVQRLAHADLHATFPESKLMEAIKFCKVDICNLYVDNLKGNAQYMLSGKKIDDEEEREAQIGRVMSCTLRAMELLIGTLPDGQAEWLWNTLLPLLCANSYWKLAGHNSQSVRSSFYILTGAVIDRFHAQLPTELVRRCARTLVSQLESVPGVCAERWRTLLKLMFSVQNVLDLMDNKDLLVKRLWDVFENAAWGGARQLVDVLVPLLQMVPANMRSEQFYNKLFAAQFTGLRQNSLLSNVSEREHWNVVIANSIRYVSASHRRDSYVVGLVGWAHRTWLEKVLSVPNFPGKAVLISSTATRMTDVVEYWLKLADDGGNPPFERIVRQFWLNVGSPISADVETLPADTDDIVKLTDAHMQFIIALKKNIDTREKRDASPGDTEPDVAPRDRCLRDLEAATETLVGNTLESAHKHKLIRKILPVVMPVLKEFHSLSLLQKLAKKFEVESIFKFYEQVLKVWLTDDSQRCVTVVKLGFLLVPYLENDEQDALFNSFGELSPEVVRWCLGQALVTLSTAAARWLRSAAATDALVSLARLQEDEEARELLLAALAHHENGDVIVSDAAVSGAVSACTDLLNALIAHDDGITLPAEAARARRRRDGTDPFARLEPRVMFAARVVHALPATRAPTALPLLLSLFRLTLRIPRGSPQLAVDAWTDALWAWREAARRLPRAPRADFVRDALRHLHWHLFFGLETLNIKRIDHMVSLCPYFVITSDARPEAANLSELVEYSRLLLDLEPVARPTQLPLEVFALQMDVIWGDISCPFERDTDWIDAVVKREAVLTKETVMIHMHKILFRATYIKEILLHPVPPEDEPEAPLGTWCDAVIRKDYFQEQFCNILHDYAVLNVLDAHYSFWKHYDIIHDGKDRMDDLVFDMVAQIPGDVHDVLAVSLERLAATHGYYWSYAKQQHKQTLSTVQRLTAKVEQTLAELPEVSAPKGTSDDVTAEEQGFADATPEGAAERPESRQSHSSSSFEILDTVANVDRKASIDAVGTATSNGVAVGELDLNNLNLNGAQEPCACHQLHASIEDVFAPLLLDELKTELNCTSFTSTAAIPKPKLATTCSQAATYVHRLDEMMLKNGYFHNAQMKAAEVKRQKSLAKVKFDQMQDTVLTEFEINGQYKIFDKWTDEPAAYRQLNVDIDEGVLYAAKDFAMLRAYYCVYASRAPHVDHFICDVAAETTHCYLDAVINGYYRHNDTMLFERSLRDASWLQLNGTAAVLDLLCEAATSRGWDASALHWDFTNIALCSALSSLTLSLSMWHKDVVRMALVARPTLELYVRVRRFIDAVRRECMRRMPSAHVAALPREWGDIFAPDATKNIYLLICLVLESSTLNVNAAQVAILYWLVEASKLLEVHTLPTATNNGQLNLERAVRAATRVLAETCHHGFKYLAYYTLRTLAPSLIKADEARVAARAAVPNESADDDEDAVFPDLSLGLYDEHLDQLQELVDAVLSNYVFCEDICEILPHSDSHSVVLGYLLLCVALHRHCELATGDLAMHYGTIFNTHAYVEDILPTVLRLLPPGVVHYMAARLPTLQKRFLPWFIRLQDFDLSEPCSATGIARLACGVLLRALGGPGSAAARGWWAVQRPRDSAALARLVTVAVAPPLLNHQLAEVQARARQLGPSVKVSVCWSARSASCALRGSGEGGANPPELRVSLSTAHPLHAPRVHSSPASADPYWIARFLSYRNGRVFHVMQMWIAAVSAELRDRSLCYVCYCLAHPNDGTSPAVSCHQCRNTFHSCCIRRWFRTSNRSNCPICRTNF